MITILILKNRDYNHEEKYSSTNKKYVASRLLWQVEFIQNITKEIVME